LQGAFEAEIDSQCSRCLDYFRAILATEFEELYVFENRAQDEFDEEIIPEDGYITLGSRSGITFCWICPSTWSANRTAREFAWSAASTSTGKLASTFTAASSLNNYRSFFLLRWMIKFSIDFH